MDGVLITFDVDWAPEWAIGLCADLCAKAGAKATFFATHQSEVLNELAADPRFEVGIHPNFLPNSTQGESAESIMRECLSFAPRARSMRTHSLVQSSPIFEMVGSHFAQIETDLSLLLPFHANLQPVDCFVGEPSRRMVRLPYHWEDDMVATWPGWNWEATPIFAVGLNSVNFHPILVALNSATLDSYRTLKRQLSGRHLSQATPDDLTRLVSEGAGTRSYLVHLLELLSGQPTLTASEATGRWLREHPTPIVTFQERPSGALGEASEQDNAPRDL